MTASAYVGIQQVFEGLGVGVEGNSAQISALLIDVVENVAIVNQTEKVFAGGEP